MRYITTFALLLSIGCGASSPGPTGGDAAVDAGADVGGVDGATGCGWEGAFASLRQPLCSSVADQSFGTGGSAGDLHGEWLDIAMRLGADDAVTMCPLPPPCEVCGRGTRIWRNEVLVGITRTWLANGHHCP